MIAATTNSGASLFFGGVWLIFEIVWIVSIEVAKNFGHGAGFGILLWLFAPIMYLILGFDSDEYRPVNAWADQVSCPRGGALAPLLGQEVPSKC